MRAKPAQPHSPPSSPIAIKMPSDGPRLPPRPLGMAFGEGGPSAPAVELFMDLACPFSGRLFAAVHPASRPGGALHGKARFIFQHVVQPWHPQSEVMHAAALAVRELRGEEKALDFCLALFEAYDDFTDEAVGDETRDVTAGRLAALAAAAAGAQADAVLPLITKGDDAYKRTLQALKWTVKQHRSRAVHVTPTVFVHGIEAPQISSSWTTGQWAELLDELAAAAE